MKSAVRRAVTTTKKETDKSRPSNQERKMVAELRAVQIQLEREMRQYDKVMAKVADKSSRGQ